VKLPSIAGSGWTRVIERVESNGVRSGRCTHNRVRVVCLHFVLITEIHNSDENGLRNEYTMFPKFQVQKYRSANTENLRTRTERRFFPNQNHGLAFEVQYIYTIALNTI